MEEVKQARQRKGGRPRAIPQSLVPRVLSLYGQGLGYRAISGVLDKEFGVVADWSTIRRLIKAAAKDQ